MEAMEPTKLEIQFAESFDTLKGYYYDHKPDDPDFLAHDPDTASAIAKLDDLKLDPVNPSTADAVHALGQLVYFLDEWFPDSIDEEDQEELRECLQEARELIEAHQ